MGSRENFKKTINHEEPERLVVDFGATAVSGIHVKAVENLRNYYGLENKPVRVIDPYQMLGEVDEELMDILGVDVVGAWGRTNIFGFENHTPFKELETLWGQRVLVPENFTISEDVKGDWLMYPEGDSTAKPSARMPKNGFFFDAIIRQEPLVEDNISVEDNLEEFTLISEDDLAFWEREADRAFNEGKAVIAGFGGTALGDIALVPAMQLKYPKGVRDITEWYMSTLMRPGLIKGIFDRQVEVAIENLSRIYSRVGNKVDAIFVCGTDFGTQDSTFCSTEQFDDLWLLYYQRMNNWIHENTQWKTFKHSCGAVESFMGRFIKAGFDIINPVQVNARGMDPSLLKAKYGHDLVFWGGGVDTQKTLPFGTKEQIRKQVLKHCEIFGKDGGFVFNTVHNIQANTPVDNMVAMFDALCEFRE